MRLRNHFLKQLYLWVICCHYSYQKVTVQIRGLGLRYLHFFCSVCYCSLCLTYREPLRYGWMYLLCQYGALSLTLLYEVAVISLELFGYFICLNSSSEFHPLPIQYFSTCPPVYIKNKKGGGGGTGTCLHHSIKRNSSL